MFFSECCISNVPINHIICPLFGNFKIKTAKFTARAWKQRDRKNVHVMLGNHLQSVKNGVWFPE